MKDVLHMREAFDTLRPYLIKLVAILLVICLIAPQPTRGQFGIDLGAVVVAIEAIGSAIQSVIGPGLQAINNALRILLSVLNTIQNFFQTVVYPPNAINRARGLVGILQALYTQILSISHVNVASATLPVPQQLEQVLLSRNPLNVPAVTANFQNVYQAVPAASDASPEARNLIDMTDAAAQDAMKRSIAIDAIADTEMQAANQINTELQQAAPGTAPMVEAEAAAWLVRANAYTQSAYADAMRVRAIDLADKSDELKFNAWHAGQIRQNTLDSLK
jgi:hypothetical protein